MPRPIATLWLLGCSLIASTGVAGLPAHVTQPAVRASDAWVISTGGSDPEAGATVANGTMYDVYVVAAETDAAASVELVQSKGGAVTPVKEILVPAFDSIEMAPNGTHLILRNVKVPLKPGMEVTIVLQTDAGDRLSVKATVKPKP